LPKDGREVVNLSKELSGKSKKHCDRGEYKFSPAGFNGEEKGGRI